MEDTTYGHDQTEPEDISIIVFFPEDKPFKNINMAGIAPGAKAEGPIQGPAANWMDPDNQTYYWTIHSQRPNFYYKVAWTW